MGGGPNSADSPPRSRILVGVVEGSGLVLLIDCTPAPGAIRSDDCQGVRSRVNRRISSPGDATVSVSAIDHSGESMAPITMDRVRLEVGNRNQALLDKLMSIAGQS